ncbi:hypothetical protein B0H12DRAFT_1077386 [Mycena haematopus]|nr:hypothetical protein B0H12DRAFT_1077386 [Mycena haematopus]
MCPPYLRVREGYLLKNAEVSGTVPGIVRTDRRRVAIHRVHRSQVPAGFELMAFEYLGHRYFLCKLDSASGRAKLAVRIGKPNFYIDHFRGFRMRLQYLFVETGYILGCWRTARVHLGRNQVVSPIVDPTGRQCKGKRVKKFIGVRGECDMVEVEGTVRIDPEVLAMAFAGVVLMLAFVDRQFGWKGWKVSWRAHLMKVKPNSLRNIIVNSRQEQDARSTTHVMSRRDSDNLQNVHNGNRGTRIPNAVTSRDDQSVDETYFSTGRTVPSRN